MNHPTQWIDDRAPEVLGVPRYGRLTIVKFFLRYPIFLLAFGPPILRSSAGIDATKGTIDLWSILQVGLLGMVAMRAMYRLATSQTVAIPRQIRSILKWLFFLGVLFLASAIYSPSRSTSAAYSILYFLSMICVVEFIADVYKSPPDWLQCIFQVRLIAILLFVVVLLVLPFAPQLVLAVLEGVGIRLGGGAVAPVTVICPMIAIISAYTYLHSIEPRGRATFFFLVGLVGTLVTQSRGSELALILCLVLVAGGWAKTGRKTAYIFISGLMAFILLSGLVLGAGGGGRIWTTFNRGQDAAVIATASGRTDIGKFVIDYCMKHPQGMGYIAGFRVLFKSYFVLGMTMDSRSIGSTHNAFVQPLADAGWLALAVYLVILMKVIAMAWRFGKKQAYRAFTADHGSREAIRCAFILLVFCLSAGMDTDQFGVPLKQCFYIQNLIIAIILGISARMLAASRAANASSVR